MIWKKCRAAPNYFISEQGDFFSVKTGKIIKQSKSNSGYFFVVIRLNGRYKSTFTHREVADAFLGKTDGFDVNHKNGIKTDNAISNLEVITRKQNIDHALLTGLRKTKYSKETIQAIRDMFKDGVRQSDICKLLGVSKYLVFDVVRGRSRNVV